MDLILGGFADERLTSLSAVQLDAYEEMLNENDQDLYKWVSGAQPTPDQHQPILSVIADFHEIKR